MNRPIALDLFAGCGGFSLGFEQAGFDVVAAVEIDPIHCATHQYNFPYCSVICKNITTVTGAEFRSLSAIGNNEIDVVFGGSPYQKFSIIGKRNLDDFRNNLVKQFIRLVLELQPKYFVFENVKGITTGKYKGLILEILDAFRSNGYDVEENYKILNAANYGVAQHRERLFLLGCRKGLELPSYPLPLTRLSNSKNYAYLPVRQVALPVCPTVWDAIADLPNPEDYPELLSQDWIMAPEYGKPSCYAGQLRGLFPVEDDYSYPRIHDPRLLTSSLRTKHSMGTIERFEATLPGTIEPTSHFNKLHPQGICPTLRAGTDRSRGSHTAPRPIHPFTPRVITVREAGRLHSYPDWFRFHVTKAHGFRQVGNSVPPLLGKALGAEIIKALGIIPLKPTAIQELEDEKLLKFNMSEAAKYFGVEPCIIEKRIRKTGIF